MVERQFDSHVWLRLSPPRLSRVAQKLTVAKYYAIAMTPQSPERLWYYYNQLFEVKTLLTFSAG
jgi:hypothetical protein